MPRRDSSRRKEQRSSLFDFSVSTPALYIRRASPGMVTRVYRGKATQKLVPHPANPSLTEMRPP